MDKNNWEEKIENWGNEFEKKFVEPRKPFLSRMGYFVEFLLNLAFLYLLFNVQAWFPEFFKENFTSLLWVMALSSFVNLFVTLVRMIFLGKRVHAITEVVSNIFGIISLIVMITLFPFNLNDQISYVIRFALTITAVIVVIATIVNLIKFVISILKD